MALASNSDSLLTNLQIESSDCLSEQDIANLINSAFLEPTKSFQRLESVPSNSEDLSPLTLPVPAVLSALKKLNPQKAAGPDGVPNWLLKEYAEILARPVTSVLNSSFAEKRCPPSWKMADMVPVPKQKPVTDINKHLRPISLTPTISKLAEDFIVAHHIGPAVMEVIDPNQFGGIPVSSTLHALTSMLHTWTQATDGTRAAVRIMLFDYRKAFDLIDHTLPVRKVFSLSIPRGVACWVADFLSYRKQRVKLSVDCFSEWGSVPAGVPQGTKLGPWLFLLMINDLKVPNVNTWKYVDDTTIAELVPRGARSNIQSAVSVVEDWSREQNMQLNADKCKEMIIDFKKNKHAFSPAVVNGKELAVVNSAKILGITLSNDLKWNIHVNETIKKVNKRLYFLVLLKRAGVSYKDIVNFYCTVIIPVLEYCSPIFHHSLPDYLSDDLERVQKRALSIIAPDKSYKHIHIFSM